MKKRIILVIASTGYQPIEYGVPKRILEDAGFEVVTVSDASGTAVSADETINTRVDYVITDVEVGAYDGLFFIGGSGALTHLDTQVSYTLLQKWKETGKPYGAICISPRILAHAGVLTGKRATGWDGDGKLAGIFEQYQVEYIRDPVVVDGNIVTASGPGVAKEFGEAIVQMFNI